jgi:glycosyltransferase involved in cell wall biosynthesis
MVIAMTSAEQRQKQNALPRICILTESYYPVTGGGETQTRTLAEGLGSAGFRVVIVTRRSSAALKETDIVDGVTVYRIPPISCGRLTRWVMVFTSCCTLVKLRREYDCLLVSGFKALGLSAVVIGKLFQKKCILKADSNGEMSGEFFSSGLKDIGLSPQSAIVRLLLSWRNRLLRAADSFVAITTGIEDEFRTHGVNPNCVTSISNSVDTKTFHPVGDARKKTLRRRLMMPQKDIVAAYVGRLVSYKGLRLLLRVAEKIARERKNVGFAVVGTGGADIHNCEDELKEYVRVNQLTESIVFSGEVRNVYEYLQASDIFLFPSEEDAFPVALIEAMSCGLPVISTPVGGIKEIVDDGRNGVTFEPGNFRQFYLALRLLIDDPDLRASLGRAALKTVHERYSAAVVTGQYARLIKRIHFEPVVDAG